MPAPAQLSELQAWMMRAIAASDGGAATPVDCVLPSQSQSSEQRLAVYQHAYLARLLECLRESFPVLVGALRQEQFNQFAAEYVGAHPPGSYSLNHLADRFVEHLRATRPADLPTPGWPDFLIELAQVEHTIGEVFDGPGLEDASPLDVSPLAEMPSDRWSELRLVPAPCLRLLAFAYPINDFYTAAKQDQSPPWPEPGPSWLAIMRGDYVVRRVPLERAEYQVLAALVSGQTLGKALASGMTNATQVAEWFAAWGRLRFFSDLAGKSV